MGLVRGIGQISDHVGSILLTHQASCARLLSSRVARLMGNLRNNVARTKIR